MHFMWAVQVFIFNLVVHILTYNIERVKRKISTYESKTQYVWFMSVYVSHQFDVKADDTYVTQSTQFLTFYSP